MIVVAGAGPAGLAAALAAARAGHEVTLAEAAPVVGGMAGSFEVGGVRVDHGSHRLHPAMSDDVRGLLAPLLGDDLQERERRGRVRIAGRWLSFPLRTSELLGALPRDVAARMALDAGLAPLRRERDDTFAEVVRAGLGPAVLDEFYGPYARKLWGRSPDELSGDIARRRIAATSPVAMAGKLLRARRSGGRRFLYPRGGFGTIVERLAEACVDAGVDLRLDAPLREARATDVGVEVVVGDERVTAASLLSTVPLAALLRALGEEPRAIEHRGLQLAYLVIDGAPWTTFDAHYLPGLDVVAGRLSEPRNYRDDPADPPDRTVLCFEIPTSPGDPWWDPSPDHVRDRLLDDLARLGLPVPVVEAVELRRVDRVYPVYGPGADPLPAAEALVDRHPGVATLGRGGRVNADNTHHAIDMGLAAARALRADGSISDVAWRVHRRRFADHVVED